MVVLVITIIILLILAGIAIATLTQTGLFENAKQAKNITDNSQVEENKTLISYEEKIESINSSNREENNKNSNINIYVNDEKILVVANFYDKNEEFVLDKSIKYESCEILLSNYKDSSENIEKINLRPYEAIIYKLK